MQERRNQSLICCDEGNPSVGLSDSPKLGKPHYDIPRSEWHPHETGLAMENGAIGYFGIVCLKIKHDIKCSHKLCNV